MNLITDAKKIAAAITSIKGRGNKLDADIQLAGLSVLQHAKDSGDTTLADRLVDAMPKGARKLALVEWLLAYGTFAKIDANTKEGKVAIAAGRLFQHDKTRNLQLDAAHAKAWYEFRKEPHVSTAFDAQASTKALLKKLQEASAAGLSVQGRIEAAANLRAALAMLEA